MDAKLRKKFESIRDASGSDERKAMIDSLSKDERDRYYKWVTADKFSENIGYGTECDSNRKSALSTDDRGILYNNEARLFRIRYDGKYIYVSLDDFVKALRVYADKEDLE